MFLWKYETIKVTIFSPLFIWSGQYFYVLFSLLLSQSEIRKVIQDGSVCVRALIAALWHVHFTKVKCAAVAAWQMPCLGMSSQQIEGKERVGGLEHSKTAQQHSAAPECKSIYIKHTLKMPGCHFPIMCLVRVTPKKGVLWVHNTNVFFSYKL